MVLEIREEMKRLYINLDRDLELQLNRYLERQGPHHGFRAEILRRALREFLRKEESNGPSRINIGKLRILER